MVDDVCRFVLRFCDVSFLVSNFLSSHTCHLGYQEYMSYKTVVFLILSAIRARICVLAGVIVHTKNYY